MDFNAKERISALRVWQKDKGISSSKIEKVFSMLELGKRDYWDDSKPEQYPRHYIQDDSAQGWHQASKYPWVESLEKNYQAFQAEAIRVIEEQRMSVHPENPVLVSNGSWNTYLFYKKGISYPKNQQKCPNVMNVLQKIPDVKIAGNTYFSAMTPGTHVRTHCAPHNFKLRTHLGLVIPEGTSIRVGKETRNWTEGKCLVLDDSFEHEVYNNSEHTRIILIVDTWNPTLTNIEIEALTYIMPEFYNDFPPEKEASI